MSLPIIFTDKVNSPELQAFLQAYGEDKYLTAEEINQIRDGINSLFNLTGAGSGITNNTGFNFVGGNLIFNQFFSWKFLGVETVLDENFSIPVPYADANKHRLDLIVARNGVLIRIPGLEYDLETPAPEPLYDSYTDLRITAFEVNESGFGSTSDVIVGDIMVKKSFAQSYVLPDITGTNASIPIPANGSSQIVLSNTLLTSIACLDLSEIVGNPSAEVPYVNKLIEITNSTGNEVELKHATGSGIQFFTKDGLSILIPNKESVYVKYNADGVVEAFRSWSSAISLRTGRYEHHIQNTLSASTGWWGYRYNAATATKWAPYFETGFWDGASLNSGFRGWADVVEFDQEVTSLTVRQIRNTVETKLHVVYFEIIGANCVNAHLIKEIVLPADASGLIKEIQEFAVTPFTMKKNGLVTAFYFNNNLSDAISHLSIYVNYKEKL